MCPGAILGHVWGIAACRFALTALQGSLAHTEEQGIASKAQSVCHALHARQIGGRYREGREGSRGLWVRGAVQHSVPVSSAFVPGEG